MHSLSLTFAEIERLLKIFVWVVALIGLLLFGIRVHFFKVELATAVWQSFTASLTATTLLFGLLSKLNWTSPTLAKWMRRPVIHGVWFGTLSSNFLANGKPISAIPIAFVIRQTYLTLSIESFTRNQDGESKLESLMQNAKTETAMLCYIFELRRLYQGENKLTTGAGELKLLEAGMRLKGHYWTNSPTQGELDLHKLADHCDAIDSFEAAEKLRLAKGDA